MKNGVWQRLQTFFSVKRIPSLDAAMTVGLTVREFKSLADDEKLSTATLKKLERRYGLRSEYVMNGSGPITMQPDEAPHERIISIRKELGLSQTEFAKGFGLTQSGISAIELGGPLRRLIALAIEATYGVNHQWLLYAKLPKYNASRLTVEEKRLLDQFRVADKDVQRVALKMLDITSQTKSDWDGSSERRSNDRREFAATRKYRAPPAH